MLQNASDKGANAIINMRYDANEVMGGVTEVLAYGSAVIVEKNHLINVCIHQDHVFASSDQHFAKP